jgi:putative MATE family efflux protein
MRREEMNLEEQMKVENNILGTEKIGKLLLKFALPSVISMLVNSIYNLVDQVFIGQGIGKLGNAATNIAYPFVTLAMALGLMVSVGTSANMSLSLGRKEQKKADKTIANGILLGFIVGMLVLILGEVFLQPLLKVFGATEDLLPYATDYAKIYLLGSPFMLLGVIISDMVRADGSPKYAMAMMLVGAILNCVLDPLYIFVFNWGMKGAAFATITGQFVNFCIGIAYIILKKTKTVTFRFSNMKLDPVICRTILGLGISAFITQSAQLVSQVVLNQQARKYGLLSIYGAETPLAVFGIIMKINGIMMAVIIGITSSTQPMFGYNYGAKKYQRVKDIYKLALACAFTVGIIGTLCFQLFPEQIISIFGKEDELYTEFAVMCLKNMTIFISVMSIQMLTSTYYQAVSKAGHAIVLSLSRQIIFLIPMLLIFPNFWQLLGIMYAYPASDLCSVILATIMVSIEARHLNKLIAENKEVA